MSKKKISKNQPDRFEFNSDNLKMANKIISNYPKEKQQSAVSDTNRHEQDAPRRAHAR